MEGAGASHTRLRGIWGVMMPPSACGPDASKQHLGWPEEAGKDRQLGMPSRPWWGPHKTQTLAGAAGHTGDSSFWVAAVRTGASEKENTPIPIPGLETEPGSLLRLPLGNVWALADARTEATAPFGGDSFQAQCPLWDAQTWSISDVTQGHHPRRMGPPGFRRCFECLCSPQIREGAQGTWGKWRSELSAPRCTWGAPLALPRLPPGPESVAGSTQRKS